MLIVRIIGTQYRKKRTDYLLKQVPRNIVDTGRGIKRMRKRMRI